MLGFEMEWLLGGQGAVRAELMLAIRLLLAVVVTGHVLLRKREIGSAIGWIGLAWVAPFFGAALYFVFGINRVRRLARRLRRGNTGRRQGEAPAVQRTDHLRPLEVAAARITGRRTEAGNVLRILQDGDNAYPPMLAAIESASASIALSTYILRDDAAGGPMIDAMIAAHGRGVDVRVLIDGIGSGYFHSAPYNRLHAAGVPVARFMHSPLPWKMPFLNLRTHKKILVVDGRHGFTGGMNIGAENVIAANPPHPVRDTHFGVDGPVVAQLVDAFARDWHFATGGGELEGEAWFPLLAEIGTSVARVATSGPDHDIEKIEFLVIEAIACARSSVRIATPYFLPDERLITELASASLRGVPVDVVFPRRSNHLVVDWATRAHVAPLLAAGVRLWLGPPPFDHSKLMVVDDEWSLIGSSNWDMRSFRLNFEIGVEVYDKDFAALIAKTIDASRSERLTRTLLEARGIPIQLRDAAMRLMLPYL